MYNSGIHVLPQLPYLKGMLFSYMLYICTYISKYIYITYMYVYIHTYMYVYVYVNVYIYTHTYIYIHIYTYICKIYI